MTENTSALDARGSRIFTPAEAEKIRNVISKPSLRVFFDLMVYTGMRFSEVQQLRANPAVFTPDRRCLTIRSTKQEASEKTRRIWLNDRGVSAVMAFLENPVIPSSSTVWQNSLIRWCRAALLPVVQGHEAAFNPWAVTVRSTRKTWESWLFKSYPGMITEITLSQGHTETTALKHYLGLRFTSDEVAAIRIETQGWEAL